MAALNLKSLIGKLNDTCRGALEAAAGLCLSRTNYNVEVEHWLLKLSELPNTDLAALYRYYGVDTSRLARDLTRVIDRLKTGNARPPALSPNTVDLAREAWLFASVDQAAPRIRSGHLLAALLIDESLARLALAASDEFGKISPESIRKDFADVVAGTVEAQSEAAAPASEPGAPPAAGAASKTPSLDQFTIDLTARAKKGDIDPVLGRDPEIRQVIDILTRRRQNNPILTGEAGVGKTAVVEGFAQRIALGDVPPSLRDVSLRTLDLGLLQAGAGIKGEFENRLKSVIEEVKRSPRPIILFIDEAHTLIGAGGQAGQGDAANLLKPALARGELRTIAATTWAEYKKYFERDAALARRFQVVKVDEPSEEVAVQMMRGLLETLEAHHNVRILDEAVVDAVRLSHRYLSGRQLPDKSVSLLDTACARVALGQSATPPALEDCRRTIDQLAVNIGILEREMAAGADHREKLAELKQAKSEAEQRLGSLEARWKAESELVGEIRQIREQLASGQTAATSEEKRAAAGQAASVPSSASAPAVQPGSAPAAVAQAATPTQRPLSPDERERLRSRLQELNTKLTDIQGEHPLLQVCVDSQAIAEVVSGWTGIPAGRMVANEIQTVLNLKARMEERIVGQSHALEAIAQRIRTARANLTDPRRPIGVFLLVGSSGVGKTETAITLAELLYGGEQNMTVINMSEFKEEHKVSLLMGSPPGYVGYGEGGVLTEAVRRRPYSVVLLDEMEKAHPGVQDIFYQVFDKGTLRDGEGRDIDFKNTVIIMTSNAGTDAIMKLCADPETRPDAEALAEVLHPELLKTFKPAFLGRVSVVPYFPLSDDVMAGIVELQLGRIKRRIHEHYRAAFSYSQDLVLGIVARCKDVDSGARNVDHILTRTMLPELSAEFLARMARSEPISRVHVSLSGEAFQYDIA
jgi:type VI secretion system protein VasG